MFDLFTSLIQMQGLDATVGFIAVAVSGSALVPMVAVFLSNAFTAKDEWEIPAVAYQPRHKRELI